MFLSTMVMLLKYSSQPRQRNRHVVGYALCVPLSFFFFFLTLFISFSFLTQSFSGSRNTLPLATVDAYRIVNSWFLISSRV